MTRNHEPGTHANSRGPELLIRAEVSDDHPAVRDLHRAAFADQGIVAALVDALRRILDVLVLSPLGVLPGFQNRGIGTRLIEHALATAEGQRVPLLFLEGSPDYYSKHGFERADEVGFRSPSLRIPAPAPANTNWRQAQKRSSAPNPIPTKLAMLSASGE